MAFGGSNIDVSDMSGVDEQLAVSKRLRIESWSLRGMRRLYHALLRECNPPSTFPLGYSHLPVEMLRPEITAVFSILQTQKPTVLAQGGT
jgi:hypothetical protein